MYRWKLTPIGTVDYDADDDGLVEVSSLAQLDAVRWDANGDGYSDHGGPLHAGFPNALLGMGCPTSGCVGYELAADLDFDTNASGGADDGDDYWNSGHGWVPIGANTLHYSGVFEGNGHVISNLFIDSNRDTQSLATEYAKVESWTTDKSLRSIHLGLFEELAGGGAIRNVGLADISVARNFTCLSSQRYRCADGFVGGLVGVSAGAISGSWVSGAVSNTITNGADSRMSQAAVAGGLVGYAHGSSVIAASYSAASVVANHTPKSSVGSQVGGLAGANDGTIVAAYATGAVQSNLDTSLSLAGHLLGGLVGRNGGTITASYATGAVPEGFERSGLVGHNAGRVTDSYWDTGGAPTRYIVHLKPEDGKKGSGKTKDPKAKKTKVTFKNLKPGTTYNVWVRAQNQAGKGDRLSDTITLPEE